jgi:hypothetical protein
MAEVLRGLLLLASASLLVFGIVRLARRFRAAEQFGLRMLIIAWSTIWLLVVVPTVGVLIGDVLDEHLVVTSGIIALWPIGVSWITRKGFNPDEWGSTFGVDRRREAEGKPTSDREKLISNILLGLGAAAFLLYAIYVFLGR